jgi:hypothetical protein
LGRRKARCVAGRCLTSPVEHRTCHFDGIRLSPGDSSPWEHHEASVPMSPVPQLSPRGPFTRSLGPFVARCSQARGLRRPSFSWGARLSRARTTLPPPTLLARVGVSLGSPVPPAPAPAQPATSLPGSPCRTPTRSLRWHVPRGPLHALGLPSAGLGSAGVPMPPCAESLLGAAAAFPRATGDFQRDGLA